MHEIKQTEQLKRCPFCGGDGLVRTCHDGQFSITADVICTNTGCHARGRLVTTHIGEGETEEEAETKARQAAVDSWNRREQDDRRTQAEQERKVFCNSLSADETASMMEAVKLFRYSDCGELRFSGNMARLYGCIPLDSDGDNLLNFLCTLYHYGRVQGIRSERARRKRGQQA